VRPTIRDCSQRGPFFHPMTFSRENVGQLSTCGLPPRFHPGVDPVWVSRSEANSGVGITSSRGTRDSLVTWRGIECVRSCERKLNGSDGSTPRFPSGVVAARKRGPGQPPLASSRASAAANTTTLRAPLAFRRRLVCRDASLETERSASRASLRREDGDLRVCSIGAGRCGASEAARVGATRRRWNLRARRPRKRPVSPSSVRRRPECGDARRALSRG
jgi:hypothetical protein